MFQPELEREVAAATGEEVDMIRRLGFSLLGPNQIEERDEPLVIDWDQFVPAG